MPRTAAPIPFERKVWPPAGHNTRPASYIELACPKKGCHQPYRMDESHPEFQRVVAALNAGDRSVASCYHGSLSS